MQLRQPADKEICDTPVLSFELMKHSPTHISSEASMKNVDEMRSRPHGMDLSIDGTQSMLAAKEADKSF